MSVSLAWQRQSLSSTQRRAAIAAQRFPLARKLAGMVVVASTESAATKSPRARLNRLPISKATTRPVRSRVITTAAVSTRRMAPISDRPTDAASTRRAAGAAHESLRCCVPWMGAPSRKRRARLRQHSARSSPALAAREALVRRELARTLSRVHGVRRRARSGGHHGALG